MNLKKLKGKIAESEKSKSAIAMEFGISIQALNKKLRGETKMTTDDAEKLCDVLGIYDNSEKAEIFLT